MCDLQRHLGVGVNIQHVHYDLLAKTVIGNEYALPERPVKRVDGYYVADDGQRIVIEFLGDAYHGHPSRWGPNNDQRNHLGKLHKENFEHTERMFEQVAALGYVVRYVWESEYRQLKALQSPLSILREFQGKLEY